MKFLRQCACGIITCIGLGLAFVSCDSGRRPSVGVRELAMSNNAFGVELYSHLARQPGNVLVSPFSVATILAVTYSGAQGETAQEIAEVLHLPSGSTDIHKGFSSLLNEMSETNMSGCQFVPANALWGQKGYPFKQSFQKLLLEKYGSTLAEVDFRTSADTASRQINSWFAAQTHGKIPEIVEVGQLHPDTVLVLANAVYFKGLWTLSFDRGLTVEMPFYLGSGTSVSTPTMKSTGTFHYSEDATKQVLEMEYADAAFLDGRISDYSNRFSIMFLLPKSIDGLSELEQGLTVSEVERLPNATRSEQVLLSLPRFRISYGFRLDAILQAMGMIKAFSSEQADLSRISNEKPLFVDSAVHKAWLTVDEYGTEATAATAFGLTKGGGSANAKEFNANHPFLFLIRHKPSGTILFLGRVANPIS